MWIVLTTQWMCQIFPVSDRVSEGLACHNRAARGMFVTEEPFWELGLPTPNLIEMAASPDHKPSIIGGVGPRSSRVSSHGTLEDPPSKCAVG